MNPSERPAATDSEKVDQMCDGSFPASDPPAVWTWEVTAVEPPTPGPDRDAHSPAS